MVPNNDPPATQTPGQTSLTATPGGPVNNPTTPGPSLPRPTPVASRERDPEDIQQGAENDEDKKGFKAKKEKGPKYDDKDTPKDPWELFWYMLMKLFTTLGGVGRVKRLEIEMNKAKQQQQADDARNHGERDNPANTQESASQVAAQERAEDARMAGRHADNPRTEQGEVIEGHESSLSSQARNSSPEQGGPSITTSYNMPGSTPSPDPVTQNQANQQNAQNSPSAESPQADNRSPPSPRRNMQ